MLNDARLWGCFVAVIASAGLASGQEPKEAKLSDGRSNTSEPDPRATPQRRARALMFRAYRAMCEAKKGSLPASPPHDLGPRSADAMIAAALRKPVKDRQGALKDLDAALKLAPNLATALALRAYLRLERDHNGFLLSPKTTLARAKKDAEAALDLDSTQFMAYLVLAELHQEEKPPTKAAAHAAKAVKASHSKSAEALFVRARISVLKGDLNSATADLKRLLRLEQRHARAVSLLGRLLLEAGDVEQAAFHIDKALEIDGKLAIAFHYRGLLNLRREPRPRLKRAIEDFGRAIKLQPDLGSAYFYRGTAYYQSHQFEEAIVDMERVLEWRKKSVRNETKVSIANILYIRALSHYYLEEWDLSIQDFGDFLKAAPSTHLGRPFARGCRERALAKLQGR